MCYSQYICPCTSVTMVALHPYTLAVHSVKHLVGEVLS